MAIKKNSNTLTTSVNIIEPTENKNSGTLKKQKQSLKKNLSRITFYNYNKKRHYLTMYSE